ncbi:UPF0389 protein GA21628 [Folsomia candida]|uniref:Uncharacterized protein n=1 Tax=Folsomia candida TaxID=158441 RepID=A0A226E3Y4_FOLCA|nr:UPF0389 protein GA21628 [Folsomia candida]OXA51990.1 hypothetical protein Fcan01_13462 [Folsomia candida]
MNTIISIRRGIANGTVRMSSSTPSKTPQTAPPTHPKNPAIMEQPKMSPTALDRIFLTWSGQFKSKADIPSIIAGDVVHKARNYARIRINLGFLLIAAVGSGIFIYLGRKDVKEGRSIEKQNLEWHRQVNEEHKRSSG